MKYLYGIIGIFLALFIGLVVLLNFLDWNEYRSTLAKLASDQTGIRVELAGDVKASVFPRPAMSVQSVRLSPLVGDASNTIATADRIEVRLGLAGILSGDLSIQSLLLSDVKLTVEETAEGEWRVRGWPESDANAASLYLDRFELKGGHVTIAPFGAPGYTIEGLDLSLDGHIPGGPLSWEGAFFSGGEKIVSTGKLTPVLSRPETALQTELFIGNTSIRFNARFLEGAIGLGRLQVTANNIDSSARAIAAAVQSDALSLPDLPFELDLQFRNEGGLVKLQSNSLRIGETLGRLDATVATAGSKPHVTGLLSLGVIDLDNWFLGLSDYETTTPPQEQADAGPFGLEGSLDVAIEGIRLKGGLGQRIDGVVSFTDAGPTLTSLQALLPGATSLTFSGALAPLSGKGKLQVKAGDFSEFARWLEVDFTKDLPAGRLKTASIKSDVQFEPESWSLDRIQALVDTTIFTGKIEGKPGSFFPSSIQIAADTLNLDAYMQSAEQNAEVRDMRLMLAGLTGGQKTELDISIETLQWLKSAFEKIHVVGQLDDQLLTISNATVKQGGGDLALSDSAVELKEKGTLTISARMKNWPMSVTKSLGDDAFKLLQAAAVQKVDGSITLSGTLDSMRVGVDVESGKNTLILSGNVGLDSDDVKSIDLQGSLTHENFAPLLRAFEVADVGVLPVSGTFSLLKTSRLSAIEAKAGGLVGGGKLQVDLTTNAETIYGRASFDHSSVGALQNLLGMRLDWLETNQALHSDIGFESNASEGNRKLTIHSFRNGRLTADGSVGLSKNQLVTGALNIAAINVDKLLAAIPDNQVKDTALDYEALGKYAGSINLNLTNVSYSGQSLTAPKASIVLGDGMVRFMSGAGATLNNGVLSVALDVDVRDGMPFHGSLDAADIDVGSVMSSQGLSQLIFAHTGINLKIKGNLLGGVKSISGTGSTSGGVGSLRFLSVPSLVSSMTTANSGSAFLSNVGTFLRSGTTPVSKLDSSFVMDSGILLLEKAEAIGPWGSLVLDGQVNVLDRYLSVSGNLNLTTPPDTPQIPVKYTGSFDGPTAEWSSRIFERFVLAGIEQRLRGNLFKEIEAKSEDGKSSSPGLAVFSRAFGLLDQLKKQQIQEEAKKSAAQDVQEQKPE